MTDTPTLSTLGDYKSELRGYLDDLPISRLREYVLTGEEKRIVRELQGFRQH